MNFLQYRDATDFLEKTGYSVEEGLKLVENELVNLKEEIEG